MFETTEQRHAKEAERITKLNESFERFIGRQETKLMTSMVAATEPPEILTTLLRASFEAGSTHGSGEILTSMLTAMFKDKTERGS